MKSRLNQILKELNKISIYSNFEDEHENSENIGLSGISTDSRTVEPEELFIALSGEKFNGSDFISSVAEKGVKLICLNESEWTDNPNFKILFAENRIIYFLVEDTTKAYGLLAREYLSLQAGKKIAITGSAGKTGMKEQLFNFLKTRYLVFKNDKNENNQIGIPKNIFKIHQPYDFLIFEIGTNHPGEIEILSKIIQPDITVITNILPSHIGNFEDLNSIAREKSAIVKYQKKNSKLFLPKAINAKNEILCSIKDFNQAVEVVEVKTTEVKQKLNFNDDVMTTDIEFKINNELISLKVEGVNLFLNSVISTLIQFQKFILPNEDGNLFNQFKLEAVERRGELMLPLRSSSTDNSDQYPIIIDDAYNANPESVMHSVEKLVELIDFETNKRVGNLIFVLGDMLELGENEVDYHQEVFRKIFHKLSNLRTSKIEVYFYGNIFEYAISLLPDQTKNNKLIKSFTEINKLIYYLMESQNSNSLIFFKASNGMNFSDLIKQFVKKLKINSK